MEKKQIIETINTNNELIDNHHKKTLSEIEAGEFAMMEGCGHAYIEFSMLTK